jgi:tetratricopeptide (TPR) repeat protein
LEPTSGSARTFTLSTLIRSLRHEKGLTEEALAAGNFTKRYVLALERGAVRPSLPALQALARRLDAPISELLAVPTEIIGKVETEALQEDISYQTNVAKMLIRSGKVAEAMQLINEIEVYCQPYSTSLPAGVAYLVPFLRGRAHLQSLSPELALPELQVALDIAGEEPEPTARIHNLLGVVYFEMSQPRLALEHHLKCLASIRAHVINDLHFRVNIYRNVAGDYWALNEPRQALGIYREIMPFLDDLDDLEQKALVYWGMASAHMALREWPETRLSCTKALQIYEERGDRDEAASICLNVAETLVDDERLEEAQAFLARAESLLEGSANLAILSFLHRDLANLSRRQAQPERAARARILRVNPFDGR